jgi:hypothetical protein
MANDEIINGSKGDNVSNGTKPLSSEVDKIRRNSLYMTFNAPQVDDYVCDLIPISFRVINPIHNREESFLERKSPSDLQISQFMFTLVFTIHSYRHKLTCHQHRGLFLTHPPLQILPDASFNFSGTLFHAAYTDSHWNLDQRAVRDVSTSQSLVLLYRLGTLDPTLAPISAQFSRIRDILEAVPLGKEAREKELGPKKGNEVLGGYDCIIWTTDAVAALVREGVVDFGGRTVGMSSLCAHFPIFQLLRLINRGIPMLTRRR